MTRSKEEMMKELLDALDAPEKIHRHPTPTAEELKILETLETGSKEFNELCEKIMKRNRQDS